ncbi:MAG: NAD(P)-dependent oxidoreductase [Opitutaceae bacterium]|jgi:nucleoside-diphosphate-sugar epimerase
MPKMQPSSFDSCRLPCDPGELDEFLSRPTGAVIRTVARIGGPVLVLGAGGKIGLHLSLMLRRAFDLAVKPNPVIAVSRFATLRNREAFESRGVAARSCDLTNPADLASLPDSPTIFFLAGVKFGTAESPEKLRKINAEMPRLVAHRFPGSRIVAFSTGCVYPFVPIYSGGATEGTPVAPVGDYAASCTAREQAFIDASLNRGTATALVRLNYSVEFRYGLLVDIAEKVFRGEPVDVTTGYVNVIWQGDAVAHCIQALDLAAAPAVPINVTGAEVLSVRAIALRFGELFDRPVQITGTEEQTAWLNNASRSHALFGPPPTSLETMIQWIAAWLMSGGHTWGKPTGFENRDGRF